LSGLRQSGPKNALNTILKPQAKDDQMGFGFRLEYIREKIARQYSKDLHGVSAEWIEGARLGVLTNAFGRGPEHQEVNQVMAKAIDVLREQGAVIIPLEDSVLDIETLTANFRMNEPEFKAALNRYLEQQGSHVPVHSLAEIIAFRQYYKPTLEKFFATAQSYENGPNSAEYKDRRIKMEELEIEVANLMAKNQLVALVYPHQKMFGPSHWSNVSEGP
jgi:Asp-tRNA(Asn)/Glu-tRNA(Gln) amidotransferase A subunit family amidase